MKIVWMPQSLCQNYTMGSSYGKKCPYCPYSYDAKSGRLIFDNELSVLNHGVESSQVSDFFRMNRGTFDRTVMITGGEPLLYDKLDEVLRAIQYRWHITSNTLRMEMLEQLSFAGCKGWTASYHPLAGKDKEFAAGIQFVKPKTRTVNITIVLSHHTKDIIGEAVKFAQSLKPRKVQIHLDAHHDAEDLRSIAERLGLSVYAGEPKRNVFCRRNAALMALGPDGTLFECVTKMYQNLDPVANLSDGPIDVAKLPQREEFCKLECFAVCDHVKHSSHG